MIELLNQSGIEVTRSTKKSITVMLPNQKTKNRLKGGIYDANFTGAQGLGELGQSSSRRIREFHNRDTQAECERNRRKLEELIKKRDRFNRCKFGIPPSRDNIYSEKEQKMDISAHGYDNADNRNSIGLDGSRSEAKFGNGLVGAQRLETRTAQRGRDSDALLHSNPSEQGDLRAKRQILYTYENGVKDDDIRRSIARRKRELDTDDQERKERTRIAEEGLDRKIREGVIEFTTRQNEFDRLRAVFDERLREQNIRIVASAKRKIREIFGVFKKKINKLARRIAKFEGKIRCFADGLREVEKRCRKFIKECEHAKMTGVRRTVKNTDKENTIKSDTPGLV